MTRATIRRILAVALVAGALPLLSPSTGEAATAYTFYGAGYGHGIGLSQWGAYGLAGKGWGYRKILRHFYSGTTVDASPWSPARLRIGLAREVRTVHLTATQGTVKLTLGSTGGKVIGGRSINQGQTWRVLVVSSGKFKVLDENGRMVGDCPTCPGHLWGNGRVNIYANFAGIGTLSVPEAGHTYNRGYIEFNVYHSGGCGRLGYCERLIIVLRPQAYLYGLGEVPSDWPMDAMEAQAVAARTYAFEKVSRLGQHRPLCNCGLYDDTRDQVYAAWDKEGGPQGSRWVSAVNNTSGQAVLSAGALIQAYYFSSSGGYTENNENVWGGAPLSYLRGVCDPGDYTDQNSSRVWKVGPLTNDAVAGALRPYTGNIGSAVTNFTGYVRGVSGRIITITVVGTQDRQATIAGWQLRAGLGLRDDRVWINANWNVTDGRSGNIRSKYDSIKCAPGLPASRRWSVPGGILQRFAVGTIYWNAGKQPPAASWLHGPVYDKYRALRESGGVLPDGSMLGMPTSDVIRLKPATCSGLTCAMAKFDHGNIYFKEGIGDGSSHELDGFVLGYYIAQGGYSSHLGFPVTDVNLNQQDGSIWAKFEDGTTVTCDSGGNCHESNGPADLSVRISAPRGVKVGTNFRYVLTVANAGPGPAGRVVVNDALPSGVKLLWRKADQGTCTWGRTVTCSIGSMQIGQTVTVTVAVRATASGTLLDAGNVRAKQRDPIPRNNSATVRTIAS